jgi:CBS domain-containing protein
MEGGFIMKVADVMTKEVRLVSPNQTLREAAHLMSEEDIGMVPVTDHDRLVGMVTDRDIAIRGVARGKGPKTKVKEVMSEQVKYCFEDEDLDHVSKNMASIQMRRLPVMNRDKRLVGIVSLGDLAVADGARAQAEQALHGISKPAA